MDFDKKNNIYKIIMTIIVTMLITFLVTLNCHTFRFYWLWELWKSHLIPPAARNTASEAANGIFQFFIYPIENDNSDHFSLVDLYMLKKRKEKFNLWTTSF